MADWRIRFESPEDIFATKVHTNLTI
jgi:hypothetical protein